MSMNVHTIMSMVASQGLMKSYDAHIVNEIFFDCNQIIEIESKSFRFIFDQIRKPLSPHSARMN